MQLITKLKIAVWIALWICVAFYTNEASACARWLCGFDPHLQGFQVRYAKDGEGQKHNDRQNWSFPRV
jgi:hypothetical protein